MPILRHECSACEREVTDLYARSDPAPYCCGRKMRLLMPRRVHGRVVADSDGVHSGSGFADVRAVREAEDELAYDEGEVLAKGSPILPSSTEFAPRDPNNKLAIPLPGEGENAVAYEDLNAAQRDERWHSATERMTAWQAECLEAGGVAPAEARAQASATQQAVTTESRAKNERADGVT